MKTDVPMVEWGVPLERAELVVLAVHGRDQSPSFMRETADRFGPAPVRFHAPEAVGNTWYPKPFLVPIEENQPALDISLGVVGECVDQLASKGFPPERVVLWGFSQGACLLSHYVLTVAPRQFGGIILFTGGYIGPLPLRPPGGSPLRGVEVLMRSVDEDPWVPRHRVASTAATLRHAGASVDLRIDPGNEHIITDEACAAATNLLAAGRSSR
ncbi:phospholipase [Saccharopolyspora sp. K220]|uniref:alpha/beta hydrolase n=1 Tax=Saccharopolyspora soli TaxID=2926618 RepID=UPI001F586C73|nr:phospholipase [Saccharopolyspora soli]MCI2418789.1 phospholipase [Saccharopolyspora soli]